MNTFQLPSDDGPPLTITDFKVNLQTTPPEVMESLVNRVDNYLRVKPECLEVEYNHAFKEEGTLNVFILMHSKGKCRLHILGTVHGQKLRFEKEIADQSARNFVVINEKIRFVLMQSRNILKAYYNSANLKSLEDHLFAFLLPA